jgi:hypothetical protein
MRLRSVLWVTLLVVVAAPRTASAGLLDLIWEMSGPQLLGLGPHCEMPLPANRKPQCVLYIVGGIDRRDGDKFFLILDAAVYFSTGKNAGDDRKPIVFRLAHTGMFGIDPTLAYEWAGSRHTRWYSGIGVSLNGFFGQGFSPFDNYAVKLRPVAVEHQFRVMKLSVEVNLRLYPNGFVTRERPRGAAALARGEESEWINGLSLVVRF